MIRSTMSLQSAYQSRKKDIGLIILAFIILIIFYLIPSPEGLPVKGKLMIGILLFAAVLWMTEPIPLAVTSLLIMILQPFLGILPAKDVFASFGNEAVFFLIGAFIIAGAVEKYGLNRRMALSFLKRFENSPSLFTLGIMISCATLSFIMPEHGVAALFLPIITSILLAMKIIPRQSNFGKISMLAVAYGCSIGSLGTLIGGARNPLTISVLADIGITVSFVDWMIYSMPVVFISLPLVWLILRFAYPIELQDITLAKNEIKNQVAQQGTIGRQELIIAAVLVFTILLWVLFSNHIYFGLAAIAILGSSILFLTGTLTWKDVEKKVPWGLILLYGGAITLGNGMQQTGAGNWIAHSMFQATQSNIYLVILGLIIFTILLTNVMSNTGAVAVLLPIGFAIAYEIPGISPLLSAMIIALSGGLAFMLIIATPGNAITYSSGYFSTKDLFKAGGIANFVCIIILFIIAIVYWQGYLGL